MAAKPLVLDSWAMMAFFENEPSAGQVANLIIDAHRHNQSLLMSVVNAGELWYSVARGYSPAEADRLIEELANLRIDVVVADWPITRQAAEYKSRGGISYADCFAAALARLRKAELVTGDPELQQLAKEVAIRWV
jgi:predicted nucleic acid-binding protein